MTAQALRNVRRRPGRGAGRGTPVDGGVRAIGTADEAAIAEGEKYKLLISARHVRRYSHWGGRRMP